MDHSTLIGVTRSFDHSVLLLLATLSPLLPNALSSLSIHRRGERKRCCIHT